MNAPLGNIDGTVKVPRASCRPIEISDLSAVIDLLVEGFPRRVRSYWVEGLRHLESLPMKDHPRFGFVIEADGAIVGCILLIVSELTIGGRTSLRGNVSSWYVKPKYRFLASLLVSVVFRQKNMTFLNISPAPHTVPILEAQGYIQYVSGQMITVPALSRRGRRGRIVRISADDTRFSGVVPEMDLLRRHAKTGCTVLLCVDGDRFEPFIFVRRRIIRTIVPAAQLLWCRDVSAYITYAGSIGRFLLRSGIFTVACDASGPMPGIPGVYRHGSARKFYRGPDRPRIGDLADTELAIFGA